MVEFLFIVWKLLISILVIVPCFRLMGRNSMSENTPLDVAFIVILGGVVSIIATNHGDSTLLLIGSIITWCLMIYLLDLLKIKVPAIKRLIDGKPAVIVDDGQINNDVLKRERITEHELMDMLRQEGAYSINDVEKAWIEVSGRITVKKKSESGW